MTATKRTIQKEQTKLRIYQAAVKLIKQQGYTATTIRQITKEANVSSGTFYVHYNSKEDIIRENYYGALSDYVTVNYAAFLKVNPNASLQEKILAFSMLQIRLSADQGWQFVTIVFTSFFQETLDPRIDLHDWKMLDTLRDLMKQANSEGKLANHDPAAAFQQMYTSVRGVMATWAYARGQFDIIHDGEDYLRNVLSALVK